MKKMPKVLAALMAAGVMLGLGAVTGGAAGTPEQVHVFLDTGWGH
jgi:hypothetical protein